MELEVDIEKVDLKGIGRYKFYCKAEVGTNIHRKSVLLGPNSVDSTERATLPRLKFRFENINPTASLLFTFLDLNGRPDQTELGSCLVLLTLHCSPSLSLKKLPPEPSTQAPIQRSQAWAPQTKQLHVALISSRIAGTELSKYVGKLRFTVIHRTSTPQASGTSPHRTSAPQASGSSPQAPLPSRPSQEQVTSPAPTPTPAITGFPRDSTAADSLTSTQASVRSIREQLSTLESTLTPSNAGLPPIDAEQTLEEAAGSEASLSSQDSVSVSRADMLPSILVEHDPAIGANLCNESDTFPTLTEYREAIPQMGLDIMKLREENQSLREENEQLQTQIHEMPSKQSYQGRVRHLNNELIKKNEIVVQYIQLQEVHTAQQKLVQQLQSKIKKYKKCLQICQQQEATITQLELLLTHQAQARGYAESDSNSLLTRENAQLKRELQQYRDSDSEPFSATLRERDDTIQSLKAQLSATTSKCQELELQIAEGSNSQICELKQRLAAAETQVNTLMAEIQANASKWAREKACYELQLAHLRSEPVAGGQQTRPTVHGSHNAGAVPGGSADTHPTAAILNGPSLDSHKTTF